MPFSNDSPRTLLRTPLIEKAWKALDQTAALRCVLLLSADHGHGKSHLLTHWIGSLNTKAFLPLVITQSTLNGTGLITTLIQKLGETPRQSKAQNLTRLQEILTHLCPVIPVLILDEAQHYALATWEELRLLLGLNLAAKPPLALIMAGDLSLSQTLALQSYKALRSRIASQVQLLAWDRPTIHTYLLNSLKEAGIAADPFEPAAFDLIASASQGCARTVNLLALASWIEASHAKTTSITHDHVQAAIDMIPSAQHH